MSLRIHLHRVGLQCLAGGTFLCNCDCARGGVGAGIWLGFGGCAGVRIWRLLLLAFVGLAVAGEVRATDLAIPAPPQVAARTWCLAVHGSGQILGDYQGDTVFEPAGLAKLMTLYLVFEALKAGRLQLHERLPVDESAWSAPGSRMFLKLNSRVRVDDLIAGLILYNANDATIVLALGLAGSIDEFVELMNRRAELMKMTGTTYTHPAGLQDPASTTTACEQLRLVRYLRMNFPQYAHYFAMPYYTFLGSTRNNPNVLLRNTEGVSGMMLVQTNDKRHHAAVTSARKNLGFDFVLLGAGSHRSCHRMSSSLINHFYRYYRRVQLFSARESLSTVPVWYGDAGEINLGALEPISVVVPYGQNDELDVYISVQESIEAPVRQGQRLGDVRVTYADNELANEPLVALHDIERTHWPGRVWDNLMRLFR